MQLTFHGSENFMGTQNRLQRTNARRGHHNDFVDPVLTTNQTVIQFGMDGYGLDKQLEYNFGNEMT
jgi:hypothetical protein